MAKPGSSSALQRKMDASRDSAASNGRSAAAALRVAIARAADDLFSLPLSVIGLSQARLPQDELDPYLPDDRLLILLDGPQGQLGVAALDRAFLVSLIQQQTMGCLTGAAPDERPFTATDAALAAPLIDATIARAAEMADRPLDIRCLSGYRFGARAESARAAKLVLDTQPFRLFELTLEFGGGPQQGSVALMLPEPKEIAAAEDGVPPDMSRPRLGQAVEMARAELTAVICTVKMSLSDLSRMKPGDILPLVQEHLDRTELVTIAGHGVAAGRLGQINGLRALRLNETGLRQASTPEPKAFAADIGAQPSFKNDPDILDGELAPVAEPAKAQAPAGSLDDFPVEHDTDDALAGMTPDEAAQEISTLAGLSRDEMEYDDLPLTID
ncbi:FliM/FliN family flagellar motor C-terminal domain-containing protein [Sedimentitalea sp. JM2-8]|uniref:FliM/FliN family flagellar motor C-terminal domain-containing protein n=1 Tax=Sedimentitalea xiamensis TaxID=3050037 RepID=A0ABT7FHL0_9RHOB|nr:FliM/FliN family flagellar motor C-terminal domain-containing protein [Sedimentitalea xiamensis]MDK3074433.1 FliM/FliN family flagellar motor C-terminal domain-containing protein [Sedimentitalea xiamensis]